MKTRRCVANLSALVLTLVYLLPATAVAQDKKAQAKEHFQAGVGAYDNGDYGGALEGFQEAYRLAPHPMVRVNMANCYDKLGKPLLAIFHFEKFLAAPESSADQRKEVRAAVKRLKLRVGELTLQVSPDGAHVQIDNAEQRKAPILEPVRLSAGIHQLSVSLEGYERVTRDFTIEGGKSREVAITLEKAAAGDALAGAVPAAGAGAGAVGANTESANWAEDAAEPTDSSVDVSEVVPLEATDGESVLDEEPVPEDAPSGGGGIRPTPAFWVASGATVGLVVAGTITGIMALNANSEFDEWVAVRQDPNQSAHNKRTAWIEGQSAADRAEAMALTTDILLIGAVVGAGFATYLLLTSDDASEHATRLSPVVGKGYGGVHMQGGF